jgi:hypothetical protein
MAMTATLMHESRRFRTVIDAAVHRPPDRTASTNAVNVTVVA